MKKILGALMNGCCYAILTISLFYIFAAISGGVNPVLSPLRFFLLTAFGLLVSFINLGVGLIPIGAIPRESLRYLAILLSFILTVSLSGSIDTRAASIISVAALFTVCYLLILLLVWLTRGGLQKRAAAGPKKKVTAPEKEKKAYKPLYGDSDEK